MIRCTCGNRHATVAEVRACQSGTAPSPASRPSTSTPSGTGVKQVVYTEADPTDRQKWKVGKLKGDPRALLHMTRQQASDYIEALIKETTPQQEEEPVTAPRKEEYKPPFPMPMLEAMHKGGYAVRPDSNQPYTFLRVSRPKHGKYKDSIKIQSQHGPNYQMVAVLWPSGRFSMYDKRYEESLLLALVDPNTARIAYGTELGRCCNCGKELTDDRSRYFGIGPECEKDNQQIIDLVVDLKGPYTGPS